MGRDPGPACPRPLGVSRQVRSDRANRGVGPAVTLGGAFSESMFGRSSTEVGLMNQRRRRSLPGTRPQFRGSATPYLGVNSLLGVMKSARSCPHCQVSVDIRSLRHQGMFKSYRICPNCQGPFEVDAKTKRRQALFIVLAMVSLTLTILVYYRGDGWLLPACISYLLLAVLIYWGNKKVYFVPANPRI